MTQFTIAPWFETPESSNIRRFRYEPTGMLLTVEFKNGSTYIYHGVPFDTVEKLADAESKGKFLNKFIKGMYRYTKVEPLTMGV